jgi:hypothetical protein
VHAASVWPIAGQGSKGSGERSPYS